ncbi:hypothetical protein [Salisediminibacterium beveridgei]|uniref:Uncharacterized protein n=1 Tax=Salisediminibacterium beveridgei TaxID=632773 RepID=A0A1D7QZU1_9BACI|nr:hypothetical protein [Salisediminibacterium beveridgei]AOM84480.1 hypothetical protein BBEV_3164 [Salisediminibacterium beveridgei]
MDVYLLIPFGFILAGLIVLLVQKKSMEQDLAFVKAHPDSDEAAIKQKAIIRWIWSVVIWGVVSMILVVWFFMYV